MAGWKCHCKSCDSLFESSSTTPPPRCVNCQSNTIDCASLDPVLFKCYGVRPAHDWSLILPLHGHALYSDLELRELFKIYSQKSAEENYQEFVDARFVKHPFFSDAKYLWLSDYNRAIERLKDQQGATGAPVAHIADKKTKIG